MTVRWPPCGTRARPRGECVAWGRLPADIIYYDMQYIIQTRRHAPGHVAVPGLAHGQGGPPVPAPAPVLGPPPLQPHTRPALHLNIDTDDKIKSLISTEMHANIVDVDKTKGPRLKIPVVLLAIMGWFAIIWA